MNYKGPTFTNDNKNICAYSKTALKKYRVEKFCTLFKYIQDLYNKTVY